MEEGHPMHFSESVGKTAHCTLVQRNKFYFILYRHFLKKILVVLLYTFSYISLQEEEKKNLKFFYSFISATYYYQIKNLKTLKHFYTLLF